MPRPLRDSSFLGLSDKRPSGNLPVVLDLTDVTFQIGEEPEAQTLLHRVSLHIPSGQFVAIVGPSGCGKSTLLKTIAGLIEPNEGAVHWQERDLAEEDLAPDEIGYVPQFSIAYDFLNVWESVEAALRLRVRGLDADQRREHIENILQEVGLEEIAQRQVRVLSGGQKRRLAMAMEMVSQPVLFLCDEVTSGLDPKAEQEIVTLMHKLSRKDNRVVLSVTHSLRHHALYDSIVVLYQGVIAYHGPSEFLLHHFGVKNPEEIFPKLAKRTGEEWHASWEKRRHAYYKSSVRNRIKGSVPVEEESDSPENGKSGPGHGTESKKTESTYPETEERTRERGALTPSAFTQFWVLLGRRWRIFFRDRSQMWLQLSLMLGFPCLVVVFALHGLPQIQNLDMGPNVDVVRQLVENTRFIRDATRVGSLVSGLVMFQVILLTLMGSNNSAREVASERLIFEKEKLGGLRPASYLAGKACFLFFLVAAQSVWMGVFVNLICHFPGDLLVQIALLLLVNGAMTAVCLGISSIMRSADQASLVSIYLVGFQLPLSGAVLALPEQMGSLTKPFIAAYWAWSGILQTMRETRFYDVVQTVTQTELLGIGICFWALVSHIVLGLFLAYVGCRQSRWE